MGTVHCTYAQGFRKTLATTGPYRWVRNPLYRVLSDTELESLNAIGEIILR